MSLLQEHHDVALRLLIGRTLAHKEGALPWPLTEDWALIDRERALWALLSEGERQAEQGWLESLWRASASPGSLREVPLPPDLGREEKTLILADEAFGLPRVDFRPASRGGTDSGVSALLWSMGFQVVAEEEGVLLVQTPKNRVVPESERLLQLLRRQERAEGVSILACYDPVHSKAWLEIKGLYHKAL